MDTSTSPATSLATSPATSPASGHTPAAAFPPGDRTGLPLPADADALLAAGPAFLTRAFHAFGSLPADNGVARITRFEPFAGGNSGHKAILSIEHARPDPALDTELFVKFSRDFSDPFRDRRRHELEAEVRLAELSRLPAFPVHVARAWFADFHSGSGTGLLITQRVAFGQDGIEPLRRKCMDHELANPVEYYRATIAALARLAAADRSGRLSPTVDRLFPAPPAAIAADLPVPWDEAGLRAAIARYAGFAAEAPHLLPAAITTPAFLARLEGDALRLLRHEADVRRFLYRGPRFVALAHWNTNIDNAWFWRTADGTLDCGLLDWGMVRRMHVCTAIWGALSAADPAMLDQQLDALLGLFADELALAGGPLLPREELGLHFDLAVAMVGLALMMDVAALVRSRMPDAAALAGPRDPALARDPVVQGFLLVFSNFLALWERRDFGRSLDRALAEGCRAPTEN